MITRIKSGGGTGGLNLDYKDFEQKIELLTLTVSKLEKQLKRKDIITMIMWISFLIFLLILTFTS